MGTVRRVCFFDLDSQGQMIPVYYGTRRRQIKGVLGNGHVFNLFLLLK